MLATVWTCAVWRQQLPPRFRLDKTVVVQRTKNPQRPCRGSLSSGDRPNDLGQRPRGGPRGRPEHRRSDPAAPTGRARAILDHPIQPAENEKPAIRRGSSEVAVIWIAGAYSAGASAASSSTSSAAASSPCRSTAMSRGPACPVGTPSGSGAHVLSPQRGQISRCC